jgi:DNA-binding XRE family transcriptional regulator
MNSSLKIDRNKLLIFHELKKRRIRVGELTYDQVMDVYKLTYDRHYINTKQAIAIGPELDLFTEIHTSRKGELFPALVDRIPRRENPAYPDYCHSQGISVHEKNPIILLGSIGSRGPSSFIFERAYISEISISDIMKLRQDLNLTQHDFAESFGISELTFQKIESGKSRDTKTIKLLKIYFTFPEAAIWQLYQTGATVHHSVLAKLFTYFHEKIKKND